MFLLLIRNERSDNENDTTSAKYTSLLYKNITMIQL